MSKTLNALRNVEIKARIFDSVQFERKIEIAKKLTKNYTVIKQRDVFFNVTSGRLKLRFLEVQNIIFDTFSYHCCFILTFVYTEHKIATDSIPTI